MILRSRTRTRIKVAAGAFACLGLLLWVIAVTLRVTPPSARDVDLGHTGDRSLGVVAGGVFIVGGIALLMAAS
jgi:hypothetical protein